MIVTYLFIPRETQQQQTGHLVCQPQRGNRNTLCCKSQNESTKSKQNDRCQSSDENYQRLNLLLKKVIKETHSQKNKDKEKEENKQIKQAGKV